MRHWLAVLFLLPATLVHGAQVKVRTDAHPDFTRVVFTFESRPDWSVRRLKTGYAIDFSSSEPMQFDVSGVVRSLDDAEFDLRLDNNRAEIILACDCTADLRDFGKDELVVEIRDGQAGVPLSPVQEVTARSGMPVDGHADLRTTMDGSFAPDIPDGVAAGMTHGGLTFPPSTAMRSQAVQSLTRQLSRAVAQGLIEAGERPAGQRRGSGDLGVSGLDPGRSNLSVTTGLDREIIALRDQVPPTGSGVICLSDSEVDFSAWGDIATLTDLGRLRGAAIAESGAVLADGALALARFYLALGFGAEARATAAFMTAGNRTELIRALGDIVDHGETGSRVLDGQILCEGKVALWAALAGPITADAGPVPTDDILATFSALPPHLRAHLGPTLAERLRSAGLDEAARNAVNAVTRGGAKTSESELVTARLGLSGTDHAEAQEALEDLSNGTDVTAAEALLELLEDAVRRGMPPNPNWVEDAPSLVRATVGTPASERLNVAGLRGRIALGQFDEFRKALADDMPGVDAILRQQLASEALAAAAPDAEPAMFLKAEIAFSGLSPQVSMDREGRYAVARRLFEMGLADRAAPYLPEDPLTTEEVALTAEILTARGDAKEAIDLLSLRSDSEARASLGSVLSQTGQIADSIPAYEAGGRLEDATNAAMRIGDWDWIVSRGTPVSEAARALLESVPELDPAVPSNGSLVRSSKELRAHADTILNSTQAGPAFTN